MWTIHGEPGGRQNRATKNENKNQKIENWKLGGDKIVLCLFGLGGSHRKHWEIFLTAIWVSLIGQYSAVVGTKVSDIETKEDLINTC